MTGHATTWAHVPDEPTPPRRGAPFAWAAATIPLLVALRGEGSTSQLLWLALATAGIVCTLRYLPTLVTAGVSSILVATALAVMWGAEVAATGWLLNTGWVFVFGSAPDQGEPARFRPATGPLVLAGGVLLLANSMPAALVLGIVGLCVVAVVIAFPALAEPVTRVGNRFGSILGRVIGAVVMVPAALVVAVLSVVYRAVGHDPLGLRTSGWIPAGPFTVESSGRGFDPTARFRTPTRTRRRIAHGLLVGVLVAAAYVWVTKPPAAPVSAAFAHDSGWPEVWRDQYGFNSNGRLDNVSIFATNDFRSEHVNQIDGIRKTWSPPECDCERLRIWWFGGSAAWGFHQADLDTIPSQLARLAWQQGIALDIENYAVPGHSLAQEAQRFAQLSVSNAPPDLAVFYDGANELYLQEARNMNGHGDDESVASYADSTLRVVSEFTTLPRRVWTWLTPGGPVSGDDHPGPMLDAPEVANHAVNRYAHQVRIVEAVAEGADIPVVFAWQPTASDAPEAAQALWDPMQPPDARWHRRLAEAAEERLPPQVIDLSGTFDGANVPIFPDWAHTNDIGARMVAGRLAPVLVDELAASGAP